MTIKDPRRRGLAGDLYNDRSAPFREARGVFAYFGFLVVEEVAPPQNGVGPGELSRRLPGVRYSAGKSLFVGM